METDLTNQKINAKVREHSLAHVPVLVVVGRKEAENRTVALRRLGGSSQEILPLDEAVARLAAEATPPDLKNAATRPASLIIGRTFGHAGSRPGCRSGRIRNIDRRDP